jgi:hypothetical protein
MTNGQPVLEDGPDLGCGPSKVEFHRRKDAGLVGRVFGLLERLLVPFFERHANTYEHSFAYLYPMHDIDYVLRVLK